MGIDLSLPFRELFHLGLGIEYLHVGIILQHESGQAFYDSC